MVVFGKQVMAMVLEYPGYKIIALLGFRIWRVCGWLSEFNNGLTIQFGSVIYPNMGPDGSINEITFSITFRTVLSICLIPVIDGGGITATMFEIYKSGISSNKFKYYAFCRLANNPITNSALWIAIGQC